MKVLLTGATGYTGRGVAEVLSTAHDVRGMDIREGACAARDLVVGDLADLDLCRKAVAGVDAMVLCHMAPNPVAYQTPVMACDTNVKGTANLYHAALEAGLKRAVLISSMGTQPKTGATDAPPGFCPYNFNTGLYAFTKVVQEMMARYYYETGGMITTVLRPSWIVYDESFVTKYNQKLEHYNASLIDPRDIGYAVLNALELKGAGLEAFNLGQLDVEYDCTGTWGRLGWKPRHRFEGLKKT